jgi:hypothetical protein
MKQKMGFGIMKLHKLNGILHIMYFYAVFLYSYCQSSRIMVNRGF